MVVTDLTLVAGSRQLYRCGDLRVVVTRNEGWMGQRRAVERDGRLDAIHLEFREGALHPTDRERAIAAPHDELRQEGVVVEGPGAGGRDPRIEPHVGPSGFVPAGDRPRIRHEVLRGVLRV